MSFLLPTRSQSQLLSCDHPVEHRQKAFYLAALHPIVEEVKVIEQFVGLRPGHITAVTCRHYADGSEFACILVGAEVVGSMQYRGEGVVDYIAVMQQVLEIR